MIEAPREVLHVGRPNEGDLAMFHKLVEGMFSRRWYTNGGELVQAFEAKLCEYLGVRHCIPVCNATVGLQIACQALGLEGEVIIPAFTFVASAHAVHWEGLKPVFCEVDPATHHMDPEYIETLITPRTSAILGVHLWGRSCNIESIQAIADRHGLQLFYDAAHAFGVSHGRKMIGNHGRCEVFSFHSTKFIHSFEGGAVATNDDVLAEKIRLLKNFGFSGMDNVVHLGTNGKMTEVCAAMGLASLERMNDILTINRRNHQLYHEVLGSLPGISIFDLQSVEKTNWQYVVVEVDETQSGVSRDQLLKTLHDNNVRARRYFYPGCHRMQPYARLFPEQTSRLPLTDALCCRVLVLPTGTAVTPGNIEYVGYVLQKALLDN